MKTLRTLTALSIVLTAGLAESQIVSTWWNQPRNQSNLAFKSNTPMGSAFLGNGAFVQTQISQITGEGHNAFQEILYRNGATISVTPFSSLAGNYSEFPKAMVNDRFGNLLTVINDPRGIHVHKTKANADTAWTTTLFGTSLVVSSAAADRDGNLYVLYEDYTISSYKVSKFSAMDGQLQWTSTENYPTGIYQNWKIAAGSGDQVYLIGKTVTPAQGARVGWIAMNRSDGATFATRGTYYSPVAYDIEVDADGVAQVAFTATEGQTAVGKLDPINLSLSNPVMVSQLLGNKAVVRDLDLDAQGNAVVACELDPASGQTDIGLVRLSNSVQATYTMTLGGTADKQFIDLKLDRFGEAYVLFDEPATYAGKLTKVSTAGLIRWTQSLSDATGSIRPTSLAMHDRAGDIMVQTQLTTNTETFVKLFGFQQAPVAIADGFNIPKNVMFQSTRPLVDNDRFPLGVSVKLVTGPTKGTLLLSHTGHFKYTPNPNFTGTDTFVYKLERAGLAPSQTTVQLHVQ